MTVQLFMLCREYSVSLKKAVFLFYRIIQGYVLTQDAGVMSTEKSDKVKVRVKKVSDLAFVK
jgi:hypothetical protein